MSKRILNLFCASVVASAAYASDPGDQQETITYPIKRANANREAPAPVDLQPVGPLPPKRIKAIEDIKIEYYAPVLKFQGFGSLQIASDSLLRIFQYLDPKSLYSLTLTKKSVVPLVGMECSKRVPQLFKEWDKTKDRYTSIVYRNIQSDIFPKNPLFILEDFEYHEDPQCPAIAELLTCAKPMLNVALLLGENLDPTLKTIANYCSLQATHLILSTFKFRIDCPPLDSFFKTREVLALIRMMAPMKLEAFKWESTSTFEKLINLAPRNAEVMDIWCSSLAYIKSLTYPPSLDNTRAAANYLIQIEDFMYCDPKICDSVLTALYLGPNGIQFDGKAGPDYLFYSLYLTDRSLDQKIDDFDLFRKLYVHMTLKLGIAPQRLPNNQYWEKIRPSLVDNKQNQLFKERHLNRHFR